MMIARLEEEGEADVRPAGWLVGRSAAAAPLKLNRSTQERAHKLHALAGRHHRRPAVNSSLIRRAARLAACCRWYDLDGSA
jgi:hypothetical protein